MRILMVPKKTTELQLESLVSTPNSVTVSDNTYKSTRYLPQVLAALGMHCYRNASELLDFGYKHFVQPSDKIADFSLIHKCMFICISIYRFPMNNITQVFRFCYDEVMALLVTSVHCYKY